MELENQRFSYVEACSIFFHIFISLLNFYRFAQKTYPAHSKTPKPKKPEDLMSLYRHMYICIHTDPSHTQTSKQQRKATL